MGCDLQVAVFLLLLLFWIKHHSTTETPPHNTTISTTHDTPNAILHGPRYDPFRVGKGPRTRAYGPWRGRTCNSTRVVPPFSFFPPFLMWTSESCLPGGDTDAPKGGVEPRSGGHAPFEKLLGEARREAGLKTGRGEGAEPRVTKGAFAKGFRFEWLGDREEGSSRWFRV